MLQAVGIEPRHHAALLGLARFLLDDGSQDHGFFGALHGEIGPALRPQLLERTAHGCLHAKQHRFPRLPALESVAVGQYGTFLGHGDLAGKLRRRHQPFLHHDRRHALGNGDETANDIVTANDGEDPARASVRRNPELTGLDTATAAENARAQGKAPGGADHALVFQTLGYRRQAVAIGDNEVAVLLQRAGTVPAAEKAPHSQQGGHGEHRDQ